MPSSGEHARPLPLPRGRGRTVERPLLYLTYARPFWVDVYNFASERYANLPPCHEHKSREERMAHRHK